MAYGRVNVCSSSEIKRKTYIYSDKKFDGEMSLIDIDENWESIQLIAGGINFIEYNSLKHLSSTLKWRNGSNGYGEMYLNVNGDKIVLDERANDGDYFIKPILIEIDKISSTEIQVGFRYSTTSQNNGWNRIFNYSGGNFKLGFGYRINETEWGVRVSGSFEICLFKNKNEVENLPFS